ncbi:MAG TPA: flagellar FliJ family protein [Acidimicrobiales bacterium]|nr:flagellar FliJ family protein [Acidimicrobiales bacterium]
MKRYHFALETVLRVRRIQEEAAGIALSLANRELERARRNHRRALAWYEAFESEPGQQDLTSFRRDRDEAERRASAVVAALHVVVIASGDVTARHADWAVAAQRVAALENLDERRRAEWRVEEQRAEMAAIDESAIAGWLADVGAAEARRGTGALA